MEIPSDYNTLESDVQTNKSKYMDQQFNVFESVFTSFTELPDKVPVYRFHDTQLEVVITYDKYQENLQNLLNHYLTTEQFERCDSIQKWLSLIKTNKQ